MAMGIVSDKEFDSELSKHKPREDKTIPSHIPSNSTDSIPLNKPELIGEIVDVNRGRGNGNIEVPNSMRKLIGLEALNEGRDQALQLAKEFGISPSSVSAYTQGATSTASYDDKPNSPTLNKARERIGKMARSRLIKAMKHLTDDKLVDAKPRDLAGIAKDMAVVFKTIEPDAPNKPTGNNGPTFVFYSPQFRKEEHYDVVQAKE